MSLQLSDNDLKDIVDTITNIYIPKEMRGQGHERVVKSIVESHIKDMVKSGTLEEELRKLHGFIQKANLCPQKVQG